MALCQAHAVQLNMVQNWLPNVRGGPPRGGGSEPRVGGAREMDMSEGELPERCRSPKGLAGGSAAAVLNCWTPASSLALVFTQRNTMTPAARHMSASPMKVYLGNGGPALVASGRGCLVTFGLNMAQHGPTWPQFGAGARRTRAEFGHASAGPSWTVSDQTRSNSGQVRYTKMPRRRRRLAQARQQLAKSVEVGPHVAEVGFDRTQANSGKYLSSMWPNLVQIQGWQQMDELGSHLAQARPPNGQI